MTFKGIGKTKAIELLATIELGKRINDYQREKYFIKSTKDAYYYLKGKLSHLEQEHFVAIFLSPNNQVITDKIISIGTSTATIANPKDVIKWALKASTFAIIIAHNHPTGVVQPSKQDYEFTLELQSACKIVDIKFVDHLIIGKNNYLLLDLVIDIRDVNQYLFIFSVFFILFGKVVLKRRLCAFVYVFYKFLENLLSHSAIIHRKCLFYLIMLNV